MHIADGVLSTPALVAGGVTALASVGYGLRRLEPGKMMLVAILTAAFFVISLFHLPGDIHLLLNGLLGVILGWAAMPAVAVALLLQSVLFQFGGLTSLGVNICITGLPAVLCGMIFRPFFQQKGRYVAVFLCGISGIILSVLFASLFLLSTGSMFLGTASAMIMGNIPVMIIEGIVTVFIYDRIMRVAPQIFHSV